MKIRLSKKDLDAVSRRVLLETINRLIAEITEQYALAHEQESMTRAQILTVLNGGDGDGKDGELWTQKDLIGRDY